MRTNIHRRSFLKSSLLGTAGLVILKDARSARAYQANEKLAIAIIGACGQGGSNTNAVAGENLVALCDVDQRRADETHNKYPHTKRYTDFRKLLDELHGQIDAVVVSTPDHTHAVAAVAAMKLGKHVYCEKPLTRTIHEARVMRQTAREHKVVTQMGNQGSASEALRRAVELAWAGTVGEIREAHIWLAGGNGPQDRPQDQPPVPPGLDWDLWLGPAPARPYHPEYMPGSWRKWRAFGSGSGGDMGCHTANMAFRALKLDLLWNSEPAAPPAAPAVIRVECEASEIHPETYPRRMVAKFDFPARGQFAAGETDVVQRRPQAAQGSAAWLWDDRLGLPGIGRRSGRLLVVSVEHAIPAVAGGQVRRLPGAGAHAAPRRREPRRMDQRLQRRTGHVLQFRHRRAADRDDPVGSRRVARRTAHRVRSARRPDRQPCRRQPVPAPRIPAGLDAVRHSLASLDQKDAERSLPNSTTGSAWPSTSTM